MTKQMATTGAQALAASRQAMDERLAGLGSDGGGFNGVRVDNKTFIFQDDEIVPRELPVVILDWSLNNQYYGGKPFVPGEKSPPVCFANGQSVGAMRPSKNSPDIQNDGNPCATCWANQFGSGVGNAKACKNQIRIAFMLPEEGPDGDIYVINVSPTGINFFKDYAKKVNEKGLALTQLVTVLSFDPKLRYDSLRFAADGPGSKALKPDVEAYAAHIPKATELLLREPKARDDDE